MKKIVEYYKKWNPSKLVIVLILLFPLYIFIKDGFGLDNDFWFIVNTGKTILHDGFINVEPFTIHEGFAFIPQQWLTCVIFYIIYHNVGIFGMFCFIIGCYLLITYLGYKMSYLVCENKKKSLYIMLFINIMLIGLGVLTTRPQAFDLIIFMLELYLLELFVKNDNKKYLYFLPLLSLLFVNLHASMWLMFFVFLLPYYVEYIVMKFKKQPCFDIKPLILITVLSLVVGLINPYGFEGATYIFRSYGVDEINNLVNEMEALNVSSILGKILFGIIAFVFFSFYHNKGKNILRYFLLALGTSYLFFSHLKGILDFIVVLPIVLGYNFRNDLKLKERKMFKTEKIIYSLVIVIFMSLVFTISKMNDSCVYGPFADYLDEHASKSIRLFTGYNNGGYMEYRGYKSYIDQRAEVFLKSNNKKEDIFIEYYNLCDGTISSKEFLDKYKFDYLLVSENLKYLHNEIKNNSEYEEVYSLYLKDDFDRQTHLYKRK